MTWRQANLSLQLASEVRVGARRRIAAELRRADEDAAFRSAIGASTE